MNERWVLGSLVILFIVLVIWQPDSSFMLRSWLFNSQAVTDSSDALRIENQALEAELALLSNIKRHMPEWSPEYLAANIYSRYPFNFKNELLISVGELQGVRIGQTVVSLVNVGEEEPRAVFVGKISKVFSDSASVQTVFDPQLQLPARIGSMAANTLLVGGIDPRLTLIPQGSGVKSGDVVYASGEGIPYGIALAEIKDIQVGKNKLLDEASMRFAYDLNTLRTLFVIKNHEIRSSP